MINLDGNDVRIDALNEIKRLGLPIFLWGGQVYGEYITEYLRENGIEYYGAAEPPVRCGESHLSGLTEPLRSL